MNILAVDTSTTELGIGIVTSDGLEYAGRWSEIGHSAPLFPKIADSLSEAGLRLNDIDLLGVVSGPGSFTGLRIGLSGVLGWGVSLGVPVQPVNTFVAVRSSVPEDVIPALVVIHSRRDEFYVQSLNPSDDRSEQVPYVAKADSILAGIDPGVTICGPGALLFADYVGDEQREDVTIAPKEFHAPNMVAVCRRSEAMFSERDDDAGSFDVEPYYMTLSQAEIKFEGRKRGT